MAERRYYIETEQREALIATTFVVLVIAIVGAMNLGILTNPVTAGIIITCATLLVMVGYLLEHKGIISRNAMPIWYMLILGIVLLLAGGISKGLIAPAFVIEGATILEISLANALFYALVVVAIAAAFLTYYYVLRPRLKASTSA